MQTYFERWQDVPADLWRWPNFSPSEIACRGSGAILLDEDALDRLQALRDRLGAPLIVTSGYRSEAHNRRVGGAKGSFHLRGMAFDIRMDNHDPARFIEAAQAVGFRGIGTYPRQGFVHIDTGPARRWGDPFPARDERFRPEPERAPARQVAREGVPAAVVIAAAERVVQEAAPILPDPWVTWAAIAVAVAALALILWRAFRRGPD